MSDVTDLIRYYVNLLIIQYSGDQPKAQATIALMAQELLANGIILDVQNAYNLLPTQTGTPLMWDSVEEWDNPDLFWDVGLGGIAEGKQLDIIGKYVGVDRYYPTVNLTDFFSLISYSEIAALPSSPPRFGFEEYATFGEYNYNGTLTYDSIVTFDNALSDKDYLTMIRLKIIQNNSNYSHASIDAQMFKFFGNDIRPESLGQMSMVYFVSSAVTPLLQAIIYKKLLPKPMGVGFLIVQNTLDLMFGFASYNDPGSPYAYGFSTYSDYDTLTGQVLIYDQITQG